MFKANLDTASNVDLGCPFTYPVFVKRDLTNGAHAKHFLDRAVRADGQCVSHTMSDRAAKAARQSLGRPPVSSIRLKLLACVLPLLSLAVFLSGPSALPTLAASGEDSSHLRFGNPSGATDDSSNKDNFLIEKKYYALSYNNALGTPNWASWRLVKEDLGDAPRFPFLPDSELPAGFKKVVTKDYVHSGFDRGHMCNHSDRASDDDASKSTFVMTNIIPQSSANNQKGWDQLEEYCRSLARKGKELYIVCGPQGKGGEGKEGYKATIANGKVTVPAKTWKVILVLGKSRKIDQNTRLIGVIMPNDQSVGYDWAKFRVPVKEIEELTSYKFFDKGDSEILDPLKEEADAVPIPPPVPIEH
jgi:endonuclease G, mitochondrial